MQASWTITPEKIAAAVRQIVDIARPRKVIVFGSVASGEPDIHSDVDILVVIGDEVESRRAESVRIRRALRGISMPMDILVIPETRLQEVASQG
jgi:predicted nucleotidyltransferase